MKRLFLKYLPFGTILFACLAAIFFSVAFLRSYDESVANYFARGSLMPVLALVFAGLAFAVGIVSACLRDLPSVPSAPLWSFAPAFVAFILAAIVFFPTQTVGGILLLTGTVFALLMMIPFCRLKVDLPVIAGFFALAGMIDLIATYYFDMTLEMNAPLKISVQMGLLCAMLYLTVEFRSLLGRTVPRLFLILTALFLAVGSLPAFSVILAFLSGKTNYRSYVAGGILTLGLFLTACIRLIQLMFSEKETNGPTESEEA